MEQKKSLALGYVLSVVLLGIVTLDFMGYAISVKPLIASAATYIRPLNDGQSTATNGGAGFWCQTGSPKFYYTDFGSHNNAYWYGCTQ